MQCALFFVLLAVIQCVSTFDSRNVVFVILSQREPYHASVAVRLKQSIEDQVLDIENRTPIVHLTHQDFQVPGSWTVLPLLRHLVTKYIRWDVRWVVFVEAHTAVKCQQLFKILKSADGNKEAKWIGYPLSDQEPTITHHFKIYEELDDSGGFVYPNFASGFAMRMELIDWLNNQLETGQRVFEGDFSIDPAFELAQVIYGSGDNPGPLMTPELAFCVVSSEHCATYPRQYDICDTAIPEQSIYFAVKTYSGFHETRAQVVKKSWGKHVTNLMFYSDNTDPSLPSLKLGVPNTKRGHCAKTIAILKHAVAEVRGLSHVQWIFLADDDTILGVHRLCEILSCYRGGSDVTVIGERYGYGYGKTETADKGYDYITGGGGTVLSVAAAELLSKCACAAIDAPDDMTLGVCAKRANVTLTHLPLFHQARPQDYPREKLSRDKPISFHRHSSPEPLKVYATWFLHDDINFKRRINDEL